MRIQDVLRTLKLNDDIETAVDAQLMCLKRMASIANPEQDAENANAPAARASWRSRRAVKAAGPPDRSTTRPRGLLPAPHVHEPAGFRNATLAPVEERPSRMW